MCRQKIIKVILEKEDLGANFDFKAIAETTEGFSGSDLKNLCISAAYNPIREILESENKHKEKEAKGKEKMNIEGDHDAEDVEDQEEREAPYIRPLTVEDFAKAKKEHSASVHEDARAIADLRKWNDMYGEGGSRNNGKDLTYFM